MRGVTELGPADTIPAALCTCNSPITDTQVASEMGPKGDQEGRPRFEKAPSVGELLTLSSWKRGLSCWGPCRICRGRRNGAKGDFSEPWVSVKGQMDASAPEKYLSGGCPRSYFPDFGLSKDGVGSGLKA